jgi:hypothetical protein
MCETTQPHAERRFSALARPSAAARACPAAPAISTNVLLGGSFDATAATLGRPGAPPRTAAISASSQHIPSIC